MIKQLYLLLVCITLSAISYSQDTLRWQDSRALTEPDFLQKQKPSVKGAYSFVGLEYQLRFMGDTVKFSVASYFIKSKSYIQAQPTDLILAHEQIHFDIGELFSRKLKIAFAARGFDKQSAVREHKAIFNSIKKEKSEMNSLYEKETEAGRNLVQQKLWSAKIKRELHGLAHYADN